MGEAVFEKFIEPSVSMFGSWSPAIAHSISAILAFLAISWLHITFVELRPKYIAVGKTLGTAMWLSHFLRGFYLVTFPGIFLLNPTSNALLSALGIRPATVFSPRSQAA